MKRTNQENNSIRFDPPIRKDEDNRQVRISIGLAGIPEEQIRIDYEHAELIVSVSGDGGIRAKKIRVPEGLRFFRKKYTDGTLEIILDKPLS